MTVLFIYILVYTLCRITMKQQDVCVWGGGGVDMVQGGIMLDLPGVCDGHFYSAVVSMGFGNGILTKVDSCSEALVGVEIDIQQSVTWLP